MKMGKEYSIGSGVLPAGGKTHVNFDNSVSAFASKNPEKTTLYVPYPLKETAPKRNHAAAHVSETKGQQ
jgi:hypothetical protein